MCLWKTLIITEWYYKTPNITDREYLFDWQYILKGLPPILTAATTKHSRTAHYRRLSQFFSSFFSCFSSLVSLCWLLDPPLSPELPSRSAAIYGKGKKDWRSNRTEPTTVSEQRNGHIKVVRTECHIWSAKIVTQNLRLSKQSSRRPLVSWTWRRHLEHVYRHSTKSCCRIIKLDDDAGSRILCNSGTRLPNYRVSHPIRYQCSTTLLSTFILYCH
jgi:hypothetical protein